MYGAPRNRIHHNISVNDTTFTELGGDGTTGNAFYYNKYVDTAHDRTEAFNLGRGRITAVYNNSIYLTGGDSRGLVVGTGDGGTVVKNNIFYVNASGSVVLLIAISSCCLLPVKRYLRTRS